MADLAIVNASPLICLTRAGLGELLRLAGDSVVVPSSVANEILARGTSDVTAAFLVECAWLRQVEDPVLPPSILAWDLGAGESAVCRWRLSGFG